MNRLQFVVPVRLSRGPGHPIKKSKALPKRSHSYVNGLQGVAALFSTVP